MKPLPSLLLVAACIGCSRPAAAPAPSNAPVTTPSAAPLAQSPAPPLPTTFDVAAIDTYITRLVPARGYVGLSVAIVKDGAVVLDKGYGLRQIGPDLPVGTDAPFAVASITKQFVSALILQLADEKKLSVDDKVAKYYPDLNRAGDITLYDLMTHVSGYHDSYPLDFVDEEMKRPITADDAIAQYAKQRPLDFEPRTHFSYSNIGYKILGRVIEKVTGRPLGAVLHERIFRPIGMTHSSYMPNIATPGLARGYTAFAFGPPEPAELEARDWNFGEGGIYSTAGDLAKWDIALMGGKVLGPKAFEFFTTPRRLADGRATKYGCGVYVAANGSGDTVLRHTGSYSGFRTFNVLEPRTHTAVVAISNRDDMPPNSLVNDIVSLLDEEHHPPDLKVQGPPAQDVAREIFAQMQAGRVDRSRFSEDFNIFLSDSKLQSASARLRPLGNPTDVAVSETHERGAMEATTILFTFASTKLEISMFRGRDGKVQQFLISKP